MRLQVGIWSCFALVTVVLTGVPRYARAFVNEEILGYTLHYFSDVSGVNVVTQYGNAEMNFQPGVDMSLQWGHDVVVIPGINAPPGSQEAVDAITTASRPISANTNPYEDFVKIRDEVTTVAAYGGAALSYYVSTEEDYFAQMVSLNYTRPFANDNLAVTAGASYSWDVIDPVLDDDTSLAKSHMRTWHAHLTATQVLTPTTVLRVGAEYNRVDGLQHDPYRNVYVGGTNVPENHPDLRERRTAFLRISQYITNGSSLKADYRYYDDDWGITSHTIGVWLSQYVGNEFVVRYRYRYYTQAPGFFYRDEYTTPGGVDGYQTGDYRLGGYGAHLFGGQIAWRPYRLVGNVGPLSGARVVLGYERYFNSNNFTANVFETGVRVNF